MIEGRNLCKRYGDKTVLSNVSFQLDIGVTALYGPSGSGKTTLIRVLLGLERPDAGSIIGLDGVRRAAVFQEDRLLPYESALGNLQFANPDVPAGRMVDVLKRLGIEAEREKKVSAFSGGMKRRVAIARAILAKPDFLSLDEPFTGLDDEIRKSAAALILECCPSSIILIATHDPNEAALLGARRAIRIAQ